MRKHHQRPSGTQRMSMAKNAEQENSMASTEDTSLTRFLMERICERANLNQAYKRVKANKGAAGVDGLTVDELFGWLATHKTSLIESLLTGTYQPALVRGVEIPKPGKKELRLLGIPTVVDRLVQQAIHQVLEPIFDPTFSESSYGFRPGRNAHHALKRAQEYVRDGYEIVVDVDVEKFFDRVNHDILMSRLAKRINDKRLLKIIRRFLEAGMMKQGVCQRREEGMPQGGPLSPLLSNLLLDELDKELESRGHKFCRYADDANIYVRSQRAGERVLDSMKTFLEKRLKLKVNAEKSGCAPVDERQFLGYRLLRDGKLVIAKSSVQRLKDKIRKRTRRNRSVKLESVIVDLTPILRGWINYFQLTQWPTQARELDSWIRRKLRCYRLKQRKRKGSVFTFLVKLGVPRSRAWDVALSDRGWWKISKWKPVQSAMSNAWFEKLGLYSLYNHPTLVTVY